LGSIITNDARCTSVINSRIVIAKAAFNKTNAPFTNKLELNVGKKPANCNIWNIVVCGYETWALRRIDQEYLASFVMWCWRRTDGVRNEEVLH
jgi:hypothetical protein